MISYTVKEIGDQPVIYESARGTGDVCGSSFLNRIFDYRLRIRFAKFPAWFDKGYHDEAMRVFETRIKREYTGDRRQKLRIPARGLDDNADLGIESNQVKISGKELEEVFKPVISAILSLVAAQMRHTPKPVQKVLLAGGFGQNKYLLERIQKAVAPVEVLQIEDG